MSARYQVDLDEEGRLKKTTTEQYIIERGATIHFKLKGGLKVNNKATLLVNLPSENY